MTTAYTALEHEVPTIPSVLLATSGSNQVTVTCPHCDQQHRHLGLGLRRSPCGRWYLVNAAGSRS
ncbi:hypothetical protein [Streptomyces vinaceus]|uniref:hypothetical protein n=1 Tax=Streptomyces vinaceus TaxID=1960 RepID=UPI0036AA4413